MWKSLDAPGIYSCTVTNFDAHEIMSQVTTNRTSLVTSISTVIF